MAHTHAVCSQHSNPQYIANTQQMHAQYTDFQNVDNTQETYSQYVEAQYIVMGWLRLVGSLNYRSLLPKSPIKEPIFCKRDL